MLEEPTLLDGAMGTALLARGLPAGTLPEEWILTRPDEIAAVHRDHAAAGARILLTCTFNCAAPRLAARIDPAQIEGLCGWAERLARSAARGGLVAGALGPTGLCPPLGPGAPAAALEARYARPLAGLAAAGVDLLWIETQQHLREALAALRAARRIGLPPVVTFTPEEREGQFRLPGGESAIDALLAAESEGAAAVGVNCIMPGVALSSLAREACARLRVAFVAKPSPGIPGALRPPQVFAEDLRPTLAAGVRLAGGCCGATAEHLRALGAAMSALDVVPPHSEAPACGYDPSRYSR